ncbi:MAG: 23S rRNA (adenine(2030)-N(6))-methyltransferase RlmJ [Alphaproteobacteria bacterium]|nr:23S rRNA (adenine(2030)-N(6))-methyltransferase RlmJ [Alphaproteobacteria bacterium]
MNYRHAYHAGNFCDVLKHALLADIITYLRLKPGAFRAIDCHAGIGLYDLGAEGPQKTGEWREGIGRLADCIHPPRPEVPSALLPWLDAVAAFNPDKGLRVYPGSPALLRHMARPVDRLTLVELHAEDFAALAARYAGDHQVKVIELDGWMALKAFVPPKERRGLVLLDPPFELPGDFERLAEGLLAAHARWPTGIYLLWYPIKERDAGTGLAHALTAAGVPRLLDVALWVRTRSGTRLDGSGLIVVNPPYRLTERFTPALAFLAARLAQGPGAGYAMRPLTDEAGNALP